MHVAIDGIIFETQARGGISRIARTIVPMMCDLDPQLDISLYMARAGQLPPPSHPQIRRKRMLPLDSRVFRWTQLTTHQRRGIAISLSAAANQNDIWHSTYYSQPYRWRGPQVVTVHDLIYFLYAELFQSERDEHHRQHVRKVIQDATLVLSISATTAQDTIDHLGISPQKVRVVPLAASQAFHVLQGEKSNRGEDQAIAPAPHSPLASFPADKPFLLYVWQRYGYKNFTTLLEAYARWPQRAEVALVVVSAPWTTQERATIESLKLGDRIHICTNVSDEALNVLYNNAMAFVYPSRYEGFGIPLLEAMAAGCPVIASDIPSSREIARDYPVYFDAADVDALIAALDTVYTHGRDAAPIADGQQIAASYTWEQTASKTLQAYYEVAGMPLPPHLREQL